MWRKEYEKNKTLCVSETDSAVIERINALSRVHATLLWEMLYGLSEFIIALENTERVLAFLYNGTNYKEALMLIRAYYDLLGIDWPEELIIMERVDELKEPFVYDFIVDGEELIVDFKYEEVTGRVI